MAIFRTKFYSPMKHISHSVGILINKIVIGQLESWKSSSNWTEHIIYGKIHRLVRSLVRSCDWTLLLRKRRLNDCHRQFGALWLYDNRLPFAGYWRIRFGEYVVSIKRCHMPNNSSKMDLFKATFPGRMNNTVVSISTGHQNHAIWHH